MPGKKSHKKRAPSAFNLFMKSELTRLKKANPSLNHKVAFVQAAHNWKAKHHPGSAAPHPAASFKVPKKRRASRTRKGRQNFVTHKGDKLYNRRGHRQTRNVRRTRRKPFHRRH